MMVPRFADVVAVVAVAVVILMPSASVVATPALRGDRVELDRVAALEDARFAEPESVDRALLLADAYLHAQHADWALATTDAFTGAGDYRVHLLRATAWAERLQAPEAVAEVAQGRADCDRVGPAQCDAAARVRFDIVGGPMQALVDANIDPRKDPKRARDAVTQVLHSTKARDLMKHEAPAKK